MDHNDLSGKAAYTAARACHRMLPKADCFVSPGTWVRTVLANI